MTVSFGEALESLLHENRNIQANVVARIRLIEHHIVVVDTLLVALRSRDRIRKRSNVNERLRADQEACFRLSCGSRVHAPPLRSRPTPYCPTMCPKFRWNQRAKRSLKRQVERMGLDESERVDAAKWQAVADAVNYDSKASNSVDGFQCYLHYQHVLTSLPDSFLAEEDALIVKCTPASGWLVQLVKDIAEKTGRHRTPFQIAERYRKLTRHSYEQPHVVPMGDISAEMKAEWLVSPTSHALECLVVYAMRLNAGRPPPWLTEESIRSAFGSCTMPQEDDAKNFLRQNIYPFLLNGEDYASSTDARQIVLRILHCDTLSIGDQWKRGRWRYAQISVDAAAERLASSVPELKERVLAKVLRWHGTIYTSDFFRLSMQVFGQRDGALACFLISREYERRRQKRSVPYGRLKLL